MNLEEGKPDPERASGGGDDKNRFEFAKGDKVRPEVLCWEREFQAWKYAQCHKIAHELINLTESYN
ncbi:hypothetical protein Bhyg_03549 [Pseudolycoriella hygida]|uniref:Uncharacterized protein n=1 Tax=Pseudolycoriella hygida TaxID=35572 RepID=A0A9Q0NET1_9DIPT|nr:hypothetical protein Bhyg_03549 [Pseudolycoriella hygida]